MALDSSPDFKFIQQEFLKKYPEGYGRDYVLRTTFDAIQSIYDGIENVGADASKVKEFLKTYKGSGAWGKIEYDENRDIKNLNFMLKRVKDDGTFEVIDTLKN